MILQARNISKSFYFPQKTTLFSNLNLSIEAGQSIAITGRSGEGKTTLLHILGTLEEPDSGEILIANTLFSKANGPKLRNQHIGFIFQSYNLLEDFTALENVLMPASIARKPISREGLWTTSFRPGRAVAAERIFPLNSFQAAKDKEPPSQELYATILT